MDAITYGNIYLYSILFLTVLISFKLSPESYKSITKNNGGALFALSLCIILAYWIGHRPPTYEFGDTGNYAFVFNMKQSGMMAENFGASEWLWQKMTNFFAATSDVTTYFTIISFGYFIFTFFACRVISKNNVLILLIFLFGSFSFFTYATNGIRNGLACSLALLIISLISVSRKNLPIAVGLSIITVGLHTSTLLPLVCLFASVYFIKSFKWAYTFWIASILISLVAGGAVSSIFSALGFEDKRLYYLTDTELADQFSRTGFRWDFLIYSMMPIVLGYYVVIKRGIYNTAYLIILNTYTLANAFWVMVIRASFSNRFAYLSWFMYSLVLAYPLLKLNIWGESQGKNASKIMLAQIGFTWFMETFYW